MRQNWNDLKHDDDDDYDNDGEEEIDDQNEF